MPQNTNLNVSPYYDDFDENKNYHRVLFKPGKSIQARELTTLQSILQNQIEKFGRYLFKDGSMVIPGNIGYDNNYTCVEVDSIHLGIPVTDYIDRLVGKTVRGQTSNVVAKIENVISESESERQNNTLYIKYQSSSQSDFTINQFIDGENLVIQEDVVYTLGVLRQNSTIATTISNNCNSVGSAVKISSGVYFIRGFFLKIDSQTLILDQYENTPSYRVGLLVKESFASASNEYNDLLDNSQGFYNFASSGADRLLIETELFKKALDDFEDENFVQLLKVEDGVLDSIVKNTKSNRIVKELARRTYDESGDYYVKPFDIDIKESLNNYLGNKGVYDEDEITENGNVPSDDLACISIGPGKAYVRGYEVETISNTFLDLPKTRTIDKIELEAIPFDFGVQIELNNVYGYIPIGFSTDSYVKLYDSKTDTVGVATGTQIGVARLYDLSSNSSGYTDSSSIFNASLYDVQTYTNLTISTGLSTSYNASTYIEGKSSGANGYLVNAITTSTTNFNLYQVSGNFIQNESIIINGIESNRIIKEIKDYTLNDARQITSYDTNPAKFTADTVLSKKIDFSNEQASYTITARTNNNSTGISTLTTSNSNFFKNIKVGDIISYSYPKFILPVNNIISGIGTQSITIKRLPDVDGVYEGNLPSDEITVNNLKKLTLSVDKKGSTLYSELSNKYVSSVDLSNSIITLRKTLSPITINNSSIFEVSVFEGYSDSVLVPFDEEDYTLTYSDGTIEPLSEKKLLPNLDATNQPTQGRITLRNLTKTGTAYLTITYQKFNVNSRNKIYNRGTTLTINRTNSKVNIDDVNNLGYSSVYGTRVEDKMISLNVPEVTSILGIFEANTGENPKLPSVTISSIDGGTINDIIKGEKIKGQQSKAVAAAIGNDSSTLISICYLNKNLFEVGETIYFEESGITAVVATIGLGSKNITDSYILDDGSRKKYFDYSRIIRKDTAEAPTKKIRIIFNHYSIDSNDSGTFVCVNSYNPDLYGKLPYVDNVRYSDILDFRPRVSTYSLSSSLSPFDFLSRNFSETTSSSTSVVAKNTSIFLSYNYYLPRIDKLFLSKDGEFNLVSGVPSLEPKEPENLNKSLEIASIYLPPYISNVNKIKVEAISHKRYTMNDISLLDERLSNVEYYTSLSLLELNTQNLEIIDKNTNLNRFKSGFFVDNFTTVDGGDTKNKSYKASVDEDQQILTTKTHDQYLDLEINELQSDNIKKVGNSVYLNFNEIEYLYNKFATRSEYVNQFNTLSWIGNITLTPSSDSWANFEEEESKKLTVEDGSTYGTDTINPDDNKNINDLTSNNGSKVVKNNNLTKVKTSDKNTKKLELKTRNNNIRSKNIGIIATSLKPNTLFYSFFDSCNVDKFIVPKLIEIEMVSGAFDIGEIVEGNYSNKSNIVFRLATPNHKYGKYNDPTEVYSTNPYRLNSTIPSNYSSTSTLLNVDIESLCSNTESDYYGSISKGMTLRGKNSRAIAKVKDVRIITNENGTFIGSLFIPDPNDDTSPRFKLGSKIFNLTTKLNNSNNFSLNDSYAEANFRALGYLDLIDDNNLNLRNQDKEVNSSGKVETKIKKVNSNNISPLGQTFEVVDNSGIFVTKCEVFFSDKDRTNIPITLEIRTVENGIPTQNVLDSSRVTLNPEDIIITEDSLTPTIFNFPSPVYLEGNEEYSIVLVTQSDEYSVWISRMGETDITSLNLNKGSLNIVSQQPNLGSLFKYQNASTWDPSQYENLKFVLYRADFISNTGSVSFLNPTKNSDLNTNQVKKLSKTSIQAYSRSLYVGLSTTLSSSQINSLLTEDYLTQTSNSNFKAKVTSVVGSLTSNYELSIVNPGTGYTSGVKNYTNVDLVNLTGSGAAGKITLGVGTGVAYKATVTSQGSGYSIGDVLTIDTKDTENLGTGVILTVQNTSGIITNTNTIILDEVQGNLTVSSSDLIIGSTTLTGVYPSQTPNVLTDGLHLKINAKNHGMSSVVNLAKISNIQSDVTPTKISTYITEESSSIYVEDASDFEYFEGREVGESNLGYLIVNNEIIGYNEVNTTTSPHTITVSTTPSNSRGVDNTSPTSHDVGDFVFKYEFNGISLRKINKEHLLSDANSSKYSNDLDSFYIKIASDNNKYFSKTKSSAVYLPSTGIVNSPRTTYNILFDKIKLVTNIMTPESSRVSAKCKTFSASSINGEETPYINKGYEDCSLISENKFKSLRAIYSKINETEYINDSNTNSFELKLDLNTSNSKISPVIDLDKVGVIATYNRINDPISDWKVDSRVNSLFDDPNAAIYISNRIDLENPADSLNVIFNAYRHETNQIRVAYRLFRADVSDEYQLYELFPGFKNLNPNGDIINDNENTGLPDRLIQESKSKNDFREYEYTINKSYTFDGFQIKIIMTGTDQANVPKIKDLRAIATR